MHAPKPPISTTIIANVINDDKKPKPILNNNKSTNGAISNEFGSESELKLTGFVGFDSLPYQFVRKCQTTG